MGSLEECVLLEFVSRGAVLMSVAAYVIAADGKIILLTLKDYRKY